MDQATLVAYISIVGVMSGIAMGLWYLGIRTKQLAFKIFAVWIGILPILAIAINLVQDYRKAYYPNSYKTSTPGPASRQSSVTQEFTFPINAPEFEHRIELTPKAKWEQDAVGTVELTMSITSPAGALVCEEGKTLATLGGKQWGSLVKDFQPTMKGEFLLRIVIPQPVHDVAVEVTELR